MDDSSQRPAPGSPEDQKTQKLRDIQAKLSSPVPDLPGSASGTDTSNLAILKAIDDLSAKMDKMALKTDLDDSRKNIIQDTQVQISKAINFFFYYSIQV